MRQSSTLKGLALAATATLVLSATAACGSSSSDSASGDPAVKAAAVGSAGATQTPLGKTDTLKITTFGDFGYGDLIKRWNADPSSPFKVKERVVSQWDDWKGELATDLQAGAGLPDVVAVEGDYMPAVLAVSDQFVDLSDPAVQGRWVDYKAAAGTNAAGQVVGYPTDAGPEAICYRQDLFQQAGLKSDPADVAKYFDTWDDYFATGEQFVKAMPNTKWYDSSGSIAQAMLNQTPYPFQDASNNVNVDNPDLKKVYDTVTSHVGDLSTRNEQWKADWTASFENNGFATMPCPGWMFANIKGNAPDVKGWNIADAFPGGGGNWGGSFLTVPIQSTHQAEAKQFAEWLTDKDQEVAAFNKAGAFPANAAAEQELAGSAKPDPYFNGANTAQILTNRAAAIKPNLPYKGDKYSDILQLFQNAVLSVDQGKSPDEAWSTFISGVNQL